MKVEDFTSDTHGLQKISLSYASGGRVEIDLNQRIIVEYNSGDTILYVYQDGEYVMDMILTADGLTVLLKNLSLE